MSDLDYKVALRAQMLASIGIKEEQIAIYNEKHDDDDMDKPENTIFIYGPIVSNDNLELYEKYLDMEATSPNKVKEQLDSMEGEITMRIDTPGGEVFAASSIYNMLVEYDGKINAVIEGLSASAGTIIQNAADHVSISKVGTMMIHRAWSIAAGNGSEIESFGMYMQSFDRLMARIYAEKSKDHDMDYFLNLMEKEHWMTADDAMEVGLVDEIISKDKEKEKKSINKKDKEAENSNIRNSYSRAFAFRNALLRNTIKKGEDKNV